MNGPPGKTAGRNPGQVESTSIAPYLDPPAWLQVAVTPAAASAASRSRSRSPTPFGASGQTTSPTPIAWASPPLSRMRATEPSPNHWCAGLSRVYQWSAESTSTTPNDRPITAVAVW